MTERILCESLRTKIVSAEDAARLVQNNMVVGTSGFAISGYPTQVPAAIAARAQAGEALGITLITGASVGDDLDGVLARANVIKRRYPYQGNASLRKLINQNQVAYADMHLSQVPEWIADGFFGPIDLGIIEVAKIDEEGNLYPTTSVGITDTLARYAKKLIIEVNSAQSLDLAGMHDIFSPGTAPNTQPVPIVATADRVGVPYIPCSPDKIAAIVCTNAPEPGSSLQPVHDNHRLMAQHLIHFLENEQKRGRLQDPLPPLQSGVGSVANAVLNGFLDSNFRHLNFYSEVIQDGVLDLLDAGIADFASATALSLSPVRLRQFQKDIIHYKDKLMLRPMGISNSGEVIRRLHVIAMNTAIEFDIYGNINSTHIRGSHVMNGIGGSGDFARNAGLTVFFSESTAKNGTVSCVVPFCSHIDHTEHDVDIIVTEQGLADLRGLSPVERAHAIINNCAHPMFRDVLTRYVESAISSGGAQHIPHNLSEALTSIVDMGTAQ